MNASLTTLIGTLGGITLGWGLTQFSNWYKERKDDNRLRKAVIFHLLEISHTLRKISKVSPEFFKRVLTELKKLAPFSAQETNEEEFNRSMENIIKPVLINHITDTVKAIAPDYEDTVKLLSSVDPVIAFYLKGKSNVIVQFDELLSQMEGKFTEENSISGDGDPKLTPSLQKFIEGTVYFETVVAIEGYVIELASKIGYTLEEQVKEVLTLNRQEENSAEISRIVRAIYESATSQIPFTSNTCKI